MKLLINLCLISCVLATGGIELLTSDTWDKYVDGSKNYLVKVSTSGCFACAANRPHFKSVVDELSTNENINFAEVNLAASPELAKRINVRFYPSFLFFNKHGSQPVQFDGKFTKGALLKFIDENMGDELKSNYRDNADGFPEDSETSLQGMSRQIKDLLALQLSPSFLNISEVAEEIFKVIQSLPQNLYTAYAQLLTVWLQYGSKSLSAAYSEIRDGIRCLSLSPHERRSLEESAALMISFADTFNVDLNKTVGEPAGFVEKTGYMCHADDCEKIKSLFGERGAAGKSRDSIILRLITEGIVRNDSNLFSTVSTCVNTASGLMNFVQGGSMERNQDGGLTVKQGKSSKVRMESSSVGDSLKISGSSYQSSLLTSILIQIPKVVLYLMSWAPGAISALLQVFLSGGKACKAFPNGYNKSMDLTPEAIEKAFSLQTIGIQPANIPSRSHVPVVGVPNGQILATAKPLREDGSCVVALNKISSATEAMAVNLVAKITEALSEDLVASLVWDLFLNWFRKEFPSFFSSLSQEAISFVNKLLPISKCWGKSSLYASEEELRSMDFFGKQLQELEKMEAVNTIEAAVLKVRGL